MALVPQGCLSLKALKAVPSLATGTESLALCPCSHLSVCVAVSVLGPQGLPAPRLCPFITDHVPRARGLWCLLACPRRRPHLPSAQPLVKGHSPARQDRRGTHTRIHPQACIEGHHWGQGSLPFLTSGAMITMTRHPERPMRAGQTALGRAGSSWELALGTRLEGPVLGASALGQQL